jgi:hypothetical protein
VATTLLTESLFMFGDSTRRRNESSTNQRRMSGLGHTGKTEQRAEKRRGVSGRCEMIVFCGPRAQQSIVRGRVQNLSFGGVAVIIDVATEVYPGHAVEARIDLPGERRRYVAGTVTYCRLAAGGAYEIGIKVEAAGQAPILMPDVESAKLRYAWFAESLQGASALH